MRQGQHSKKNRGRNRRQSNPGNRVFESNGPDVKIRGNASHVSEKYLALARDAQAAGDPIAAENYLQHAEHYLRIIAATQAQQQQQPAVQNQPCAPDQRSASGEEQRGERRRRSRAAAIAATAKRVADDCQPEPVEAVEADETAETAEESNGAEPEAVPKDAPKPRRRNGAKKEVAIRRPLPPSQSPKTRPRTIPLQRPPEEQVSEAS